VILPTYNEKQNLPLIISMLAYEFETKYVIITSLNVYDGVYISMHYNKNSWLTSFVLDDLPIQTTSSLEYEIVIVDDNSPDGTGAIADQLQTIYSPKRIVRIQLVCYLSLYSMSFRSRAYFYDEMIVHCTNFNYSLYNNFGNHLLNSDCVETCRKTRFRKCVQRWT
jgi:glycosyltransferase involved in cell wall biosynthesis